MKKTFLTLAFLVFAVVLFSTQASAQCGGFLLDGVAFDPKDYSYTGTNAVTITVKLNGATRGTANTTINQPWSYCDTAGGAGVGNYTIDFSVPSGSYSFRWITDKDGTYDLKDFGAAGDGVTDDKSALQGAVYYVANRNGGTLLIPRGYFKVSDGAVLPSGIVIKGNNGSVFSSCRIELSGQNKYLFKIGNKTNGVSIRDVLLAATVPAPNPNPNAPYLSGTKGILAEGSYPNSSIGFVMRDTTLLSFERAMDVTGTGGWQFDQVRLDHITAAQCKECIRMDTVNSDWQISNSWIGPAPQNGIGINMVRTGFVLIENTIGAGPGYYWNASANPPAFEPISIGSSNAAEAFINIAGQHGTIKIDNSQCEQFRQAIVVDYEDYDNPIMVANSIFGDKTIFKKNASFVSTANFYLSDSVETWVAYEQPRFLATGVPYQTRKVRGSCPVPDQSCCSNTTVPTPTTGSANNVRIFSTGDSFGAYNRYWCVNDSPAAPDFIVSGTSTAYGSRRYGDGTSIFDTKKVGIGTTTPGSGISGSPSVLEVEAKDGQLPWLVLNRNTTSGGRRWGWVIGTDGSLFLQDIGHNNLLQVDTSGNVFPPTDNTGQIGTNSNRWAKVRATVVQSGDIILSNKETGEQLYTIKEDADSIYFLDFRTGREMMRLDVKGNLYLKGKVFQNQKPKAKRPDPARKKPVKRR